MSLAFLFHYLMLNVFQVLIHPSSGACDLFVVGLSLSNYQDDVRSNKHKIGMRYLCPLHIACGLCLVDICSSFPRDKETMALDLTLIYI